MLEEQERGDALREARRNEVGMPYRFFCPVGETREFIIVDEAHRIFMREFAGELRPYVQVRFGLNALIQRAAFMHLVQMGELTENEQGQAQLSLKSGNLHLQLDS